MEENLHHNRCIRTFTGKYIDVFNPDPEHICIEDIAHALSNICRWGGHCHRFYSVAEHSYLVSWGWTDHMTALRALLHDAGEAYLLDMPRPIKQNLPGYKELEDGLMEVIARKFGFFDPNAVDKKSIKRTDDTFLQWEWDYIILQKPIPTSFGYTFNFYTPEQAKALFLGRYHYLITLIHG